MRLKRWFFGLRLRYKLLIPWLVIATVLYAGCLPKQLFDVPYSTILFAENGNLLNGSIANDGQWRFPPGEVLSDKYITALLTFEDKHFYKHFGVNPVSIAKAFWSNIKAGKVVRGGSTISMQVIRLSRKGQGRTVWEKLKEMVLASRLELSFSKQEILELYAAHAPFGGNVVGLETATWRYFGRASADLSWSEAALLAVLPNAPSLINPSRNRAALITKRNRLLQKLHEEGYFDELSLELALKEGIPASPKPLPREAAHLHQQVIRSQDGGVICHSTINESLQRKLNSIAERQGSFLAKAQINNLGILVIDVKTGEVKAYVGNTPGQALDEGFVDMVTAKRSSGSILKPFLYTSMLGSSQLLRNQILPDIPTNIGGYSPQNFGRKFDGAVSASEALRRSLNIPAIRMLRTYGIAPFISDLRNLGLSSIDKDKDHYGLTLILGGAEVSLLETVTAYAAMANHLEVYANYFGEEAKAFNISISKDIEPLSSSKRIYGPAEIWTCFEVLSTLNRPREEDGWEQFTSAQKIAWKTGTSFGHRDAWAIGVNPDFAVGVWVGNSDGEGRPGLTGGAVAGPILFKVFDALTQTNSWFDKPARSLSPLVTCSWSGMKSQSNCTLTDTILVPNQAKDLQNCIYCKPYFLESSGKYRVNEACYPVYKMRDSSGFVLPAAMEWYYKNTNANYSGLPAWFEGCDGGDLNMSLFYPESGSVVHLPITLDGEKGLLLASASHKNPGLNVFWHLDDKFLGTTKTLHQMEFKAEPGHHQLLLVDELGEELLCPFELD